MRPEHVASYSFDPDEARGNIENFTGVAQVPLGIAGPLRVNGEHAQGDFYVPLATSEGTLVASYNRGMKLTREAGGVTVTVLDDAMQRAPAFGFDSAREARDFSTWLERQHGRGPRPRGVLHLDGASAQRRAVHGQPVRVPALQLHERRRRRHEHVREGHPRRVRVDPRAATRRSATSSSRPTSPPTRRPRR
ncbi:MAG: hypothetical protein WKF31_03565 [Thermoleophilaceae bacterium]